MASKMYNQGSDQDKVDESASPPYYPPPDAQMSPMAPGYPAPQSSGYPAPQPSAYPPQQSPLSYPSAPLQQQPTSTMTNTNTTVVIQQQPAAVVVQAARGWSSGVCACFDDCGVCLLGCCSCLCGLPLIECQVTGAAGECCLVGICCPIALRTKIRTRHNIQGGILDDCCTMTFCHYCAFCQMQRELNLHGI